MKRWTDILHVVSWAGASVVGLLLSGCAAPQAAEPPQGIGDAKNAAAAMRENHRSIRWHLERAREELK